MRIRTTLVSIMLLVCSVAISQAQGKEKIQQHFNNAAIEAKATTDPTQKREILTKSLTKMTTALTVVESMNSVSATDRAGIQRFKASLIEKQDALAGRNGQTRIADDRLNDYANYLVQDMEQADTVITISLVAALLIIIILILIL